MFRVRLLLFVLSLALSGHASAVVETTQNDKVAPGDSLVRVKLGESAVDLAGPWKFHVGDDAAWARPDFDDSGWEDVDLTPDGNTGLSPGWTARGHAGYSGYAWYRLHIDVQEAKRALALKMPDSFDDAYQVFVNGQRIGEFGKFTDHGVTAYSGLPTAFRLPKGLRSGEISIAVRVWMDSATPFNSPDAGGLRQPPELGYASAISEQVRLDWDDAAHYVGSGFLETQVIVMALLMALTLFWLDKHEKSYLWLSLVCEASLLNVVPVLLASFTTWIGQTEYVILHDVIAFPLRIGLWVLFWGYWFRLERIRVLHYVVWSLVIILAVIANYQHELRLIHVATTFTRLGFTISLGSVSTILSLLIITVMLLGRFITAQRAKEQWKLEIAQARHVQQVLIPNKLPQISDLNIDSEYRPAREVGGDFFQIVPKEEDGTSLIVFGDVTGKGLQAGMLVALIVGAIRSTAQHDNRPERVLEALNDQLCERESASATCMVLRFSPNGVVELANAGQLPPYLNGNEMQIEGALPLGMLPGMEFPITSFQLEPGDSLMIMSDGVVEAQNAYGELFGFERIEQLLRDQTSTAEIATAAQKFGQTDDILVLRVERCAPRKMLDAEPQEAYT